MEDWKDPQQRAEEEDAARSMPFCEQVDRWLHGDAPQECRECEDGKWAELADGSDRRGCPAHAVDGSADTREKLEAEIREHVTHWTSTAMWPPSANKTTYHVRTTLDEVQGWLDRQAAITERECREREDAECKRAVGKLEAELRAVKEHADRQRVRDECEGGIMRTVDELRDRVRELEAERDHWKDKADMYRRQLGGLSAAHARLKRKERK